MRFAALSIAGFAAVAALLAGAIVARSQPADEVKRAAFTASGEAILPVGYREWHHIGTRYKGIGVSILDGQMTKTPEIFNAYVEPTAFAVYARTGQWPDGAQIVKEFTTVKVGEGCDVNTFQCTSQFGRGIFETGFIGLGMMVKDAQRFPDAPGHWGYFEFGHEPPPYEPTSPARSQNQCGYCHVNLASDTDFVISAAHVGLQDLRQR
jgi:hypothetical protein